LLFAVYVSEIDAVIQSHSVQYHQYADDLMIYLSLVPKAFGDLSSLVGCSDAMSTWFLQNALLLIPEKTEAIIFGTRQRLAGIQTSVWRALLSQCCALRRGCKVVGRDARLCVDIQSASNKCRPSLRTCVTCHVPHTRSTSYPTAAHRRYREVDCRIHCCWTIVWHLGRQPGQTLARTRYRINLRVLYCMHHGLLVIRTCAVNFNGLFLNWQLSRIRHGCLDSRRTIQCEIHDPSTLELYTLNFSSSTSATTSHYIICSESVLRSRSYSLELSWCPHQTWTWVHVL